MIHPALKASMATPAGRPVKNVKPFILKPTDRLPSGSEYLNSMPQAIKTAHALYLKKHMLPPALAPSYIRRPEVQENMRAKSISKGFLRPRARS